MLVSGQNVLQSLVPPHLSVVHTMMHLRRLQGGSQYLDRLRKWVDP